MNGEPTPMMIRSNDEVGVALLAAVRSGDLDVISDFLADHPGLARESIVEPG